MLHIGVFKAMKCWSLQTEGGCRFYFIIFAPRMTLLSLQGVHKAQPTFTSPVQRLMIILFVQATLINSISKPSI
jgi:hypothetical protein